VSTIHGVVCSGKYNHATCTIHHILTGRSRVSVRIPPLLDIVLTLLQRTRQPSATARASLCEESLELVDKDNGRGVHLGSFERQDDHLFARADRRSYDITATERYKGATNRRRVSRTEKPCHSFCKKRLACSRRTVLKDTRLLALERFYLNDSDQGSLVVDRAAPSSLNSFVDMD
jgi:hypothetical protein